MPFFSINSRSLLQSRVFICSFFVIIVEIFIMFWHKKPFKLSQKNKTLMSLRTWINELRFNRAVKQETTNAAATSPRVGTIARALTVPFALAFVFMLAALAVQPVAALDINLSVIIDVINAFIDLITPITNLLIAIIPLWFIIEILGFIMGLLTAILAMITFGKKR